MVMVALFPNAEHRCFDFVVTATRWPPVKTLTTSSMSSPGKSAARSDACLVTRRSGLWDRWFSLGAEVANDSDDEADDEADSHREREAGIRDNEGDEGHEKAGAE